MKPLTYKKLQEILINELNLRSPEFHLERLGNRISGSVISSSFKGKGDFKRQTAIMDALEKHLGSLLGRYVGMLLAFTPDEWNIDLEGHHAPNGKPRARASK